MTSIIFLGLNDIGKKIYEWLTERDDATVMALITELNQLSLIEQLEPDLLISAGFRHIVPDKILSIPDRGAVNVHKSYLPNNRGANPNVWSIIEDAPAGVSIHYMTAKVDAGDIIDRRTVPIYPDDDGRSLYERLEEAQFNQFTEVWPEIRDGTVEATSQDPEAGSYHVKQDFVDQWEIDREKQVAAGEFIDRLRALTFPPYKNAYFEVDGQRYWVELSITPEDADETGQRVADKNVPEYSTDQDN